jgi:putative membrane protein
LQHACLFLDRGALLVGCRARPVRRIGYGLSVLFVFTTALHSGALGALLTWSSSVWYGSYAHRAPAWGALEDQQLAGLIMWVPAGVTFVVVGLALFAAWIGESERRVAHGRTRR